MRITKSPQYGIGYRCWNVFASIPGLAPRMLARGLTKLRAERLVERMDRLLDSEATHGLPEGYRLRMVHAHGAGHGHWRTVWDVHTNASPAILVDELPKQTARRIRDDRNGILNVICELRFDATVVNQLKTELAANVALMSHGTGPAIEALLRVNDELKRQVLQLERGPFTREKHAA